MTNPTLDFADDFCKRGIAHILAALSSPPAVELAELEGHSPAVTESYGALVRCPLSDGPVSDRQLAMRCCERF
jgi:hypothetical protein